ncbi:O-antigen ligase family protein [Halomonas rhizosphaerae]|uniref:O-antigen ligase-related domain-containing protein n=1 Tax=Halomonas rhizosphaerae TaxID=3043296 RepID=A0ABT6UWE1_9GAMM|nr:O-antigen ligase family protein [Halomonas rhizosphaerae]MDI5890280.1 hypothetical protein [Halomonas rhizosphaerae]
MRPRIVRARNFLIGFSLFLLVASPSIKGLIIDSEVFNILPVIILGFTILWRFSLNKKDLLGFLPTSLFLTVMLLSFFINPLVFPGVKEFFKYLFIFSLCFLLPPQINKESLSWFLFFCMTWGIVVAFINSFVGVEFTDSFHYLTVGLPISLMIIIAFFWCLYAEKGVLFRVAMVMAIVFGFNSLFTLYGRSPILFVFLSIVFYLLVNILSSKGVSAFFKQFSILLSYIALSVIVFYYFVPSHISERVYRMFGSSQSGDTEPRLEAVYYPSIEAILDNPFGYGLSSSWDVVGFYPHNIFLEMAINSGLIGLTVIIMFSFIAMLSTYDIIRNKHRYCYELLPFSLVSWYLFLMWNVSYDIPSAYALIPFMSFFVLFKLSTESFRNRFFEQ